MFRFQPEFRESDLFRTCFEAKPEWKLDGVNLLPFLSGTKTGAPHDALYWRFGEQMAIRKGDFKLVRVYETGTLELFHIAKDPGERRDIAREMPDKVKQMNQRLTDYLLAVDAQMPKPNPNYDPSKPPPAWKRGGKGTKSQP